MIKKGCAKSNLVFNKEFIFYKYHKIKDLIKRSSYSKLNDLIVFKDILELFYDDANEIQPNNKDQEKDLEKRTVVINTASELYDKLLNIYTTKYENLSENQKENINFLNRPENVTLDFVEDDLPPVAALESDGEVKLEPGENIERVKLNP